MYAVIKTGGKQYRVAEGQSLKVETLADEEDNKQICFEEILLVSDGSEVRVGAPFVSNAKVVAEIIDSGRYKKVNVLKFKRRKHHMKQMGHRQNYTEVKIKSIKV